MARDEPGGSHIPKPFPDSGGPHSAPKKDGDLRINRRIRAREIRVIDPNGQQLGIMPPELALQKAIDLGLDLVEVSPESRPPVCRIMDYGKFKYAQKKKEAEARKNQVSTTVKEVKFRPKIEAHDFAFKVGAIKRFLEEGHKAKVTMMFRGRELAHQDIARGIMQRIINEIKEVGTIESVPKLEGRNMIMVVAPGGKQHLPTTGQSPTTAPTSAMPQSQRPTAPSSSMSQPVRTAAPSPSMPLPQRTAPPPAPPVKTQGLGNGKVQA